jgi:hypothetical protein
MDAPIPHQANRDTTDTVPGRARLVQRARLKVAAASQGIDSGVRALANLVKFEVVVTIVCFFIPIIVLYGDGWHLRDSISAYYAMTKTQYFYFPLTVAAMLFIVNGVVKEKHWYNVGLGLTLAGLIFFNHRDHSMIHNVNAGAFFLGNTVVFMIFTPRKERWFKILLAFTVIIGLAGHFVFHWYSLFIAESLSLWIIATHFILEAKGVIK